MAFAEQKERREKYEISTKTRHIILACSGDTQYEI
jgi:hypothetical protein